MTKKILIYAITFLLIPFFIALGFFLGQESFSYISIIIAFLSCVPFFLSFENKQSSTGRLVFLAVMVALSVAGRFIFAPVQFFKPVSAIVVIAAIYFGSEFGFLTGALSAVVSDLYFGMGPWTPFQMFAWGFIGFIAGLLADPLKRNRLLLVLYGALSGVMFSLIMDIWTTFKTDGGFNFYRFIYYVSASLPIMAVYVISNVIFLLLLTPLFGKKLERMKTKYNI